MLSVTEVETVVLGAVRPAIDVRAHPTLQSHFSYTKLRTSVDVVDIQCVQCVVGRVRDGKGWSIFDHSGSLARAIFVDL